MPKDAVTCPIPAGPGTTREIRIETSPTAQDHLIWVITNTPGSTVGPSRQLFGLAWLSSLSENKSTRKGRKRCKLDMLNVKLISSLICQTLSAASTGKIHLPRFRLPPHSLSYLFSFKRSGENYFSALSSVSCPAVVSPPPCATGCCCCLQDPVTGDGEHPAQLPVPRASHPQSQLHAKQ